MTTYLLHGGMLKQKNDSNTAYFKRIAEAVPEGGTVLIVLFAAEEDRWPELFTQMQGFINEAVDGKRISFVQASREHFMEEIANADAIFIRGGATDRLYDALASYPDLKGALEGKLVAGSSAGAYVFATYNYSRRDTRIRDGLGFVPARVICHYESSDPNEYNDAKAVSLMDSEHQELPLIVLHDCEWRELSI